jgi:hypothetical protein
MVRSIATSRVGAVGETDGAPCAAVGVADAVADDLPASARYLLDGRRVVLPTLKVEKGRIRVSCTATHRSR